MLKNKLKEFGLIHILVLCAALIAAGAVYIFQSSPDTNTAFQRSAASQDTTPFSTYAKGEVSEILDEQIYEAQNSRFISQQLNVKLINTDKSGETTLVDHSALLDKAGSVKYSVGDKVVLGTLESEAGPQYVIIDRYRLPGVAFLVGIFLLLAIAVGKWRGLTSLIGLVITGCILLFFIAPQILSGKDPFAVALVGSGVIVLVSMFVSHGFSKRIQIAALSTLITLAITAVVTYLSIYLLQLFGFGQSDAYLLETGFLGTINLQGVLLAGIIISVLGVLDDITTAQTAAVEEIHKADSNLSVKELYIKGLSIGREHIASLINTLILVYAGAALPLFLLLTLQKAQPVWVLINSEFIAEELGRSLVGSIALILAVPIATWLAAWVLRSKKVV